MIFETLFESAQRNELMLLEGGMCHWHLRRDGQLTIREIISTSPGAGKRMLRRLFWTPDAQYLLAKCPVELESNKWYEYRNFLLDGTSLTKTGKSLNHWRYNIDTHKPIPNLQDELEIIYCASGNKRMMEIALDAGFLPGIQAPGTAYYRPYFIDLHPKTPPERNAYMKALERYKPCLATIKDWDKGRSKEEIFDWAAQAAEYVNTLIIIPKIPGTIDQVPETICGKPVRLGYSIDTEHGHTEALPSEFEQRPVHLLGGSPDEQMKFARIMNVKSADGNYMQKMALRYCQYYTTSKGNKFKNQRWATLKESDGGWDDNAHHEAFRRSCVTIMKAWRENLLKYRLEYSPEQLTLFDLG